MWEKALATTMESAGPSESMTFSSFLRSAGLFEELYVADNV